MATKKSIIPVKRIEHSILLIRGQRIMLDADLAELYRVETRFLVQAVKRNIDRFPPDFMFQLSKEEFDNLRSQIVISSQWGGRRYPPLCFHRARRSYAFKRPAQQTCRSSERSDHADVCSSSPNP